MPTGPGLLALGVLGGAFAFSKARTAKQQRVDRDDVHTGPVTNDLPDVADGAMAPGQVVRQGDVTTKNWGSVFYRISVHSDGKSYVALVRAPGAPNYEAIQLQTGGPRLFVSPEDAEAFTRSWISSGDDKPPGPDPAPAPEPGPAPEPAPEGPSSVGTCVHQFYVRTPALVTPALLETLGPAAQAVVEDEFFYLSPMAQIDIFNAAKEQLLGADRSVQGVVARDVLTKLKPECNWKRDPISDYSEVERLTWESAWMLVAAAAAQIGFRPGGDNPANKLLLVTDSDGILIGRQWLDLPEVGNMELPIGRRVELLVGEYTKSELPRPTFMYPERLYASVVGTHNVSGNPIVKVLDKFQNRNVAPLFSEHHGFKVGSELELRKSSPTGVRRIFAEGVA